MSYDIILVPRRPDQAWDEALAALAAAAGHEAPFTAEQLAQWDRIVSRVGDVLGHVEVDAEEAGAELSHEPTGLQVWLTGTSAGVSYPYRDRADQAPFHGQVAEVVRIVTEETGLDAYDPQTDQPFDGVPHDEDGLAHTRSLAAGLQDGDRDGSRASSGSGGAVASPGSPDGAAQRAPLTPPMTRGRALRFLVVGALVVAVALVRIVAGEPSWITWLLLVLGGAELVYGAVLLRRTR